MDWLELAVLVLACFRLTHLIVYDAITEPLRRSLEKRPFWFELVSCHWCTGIWAGLALVGGKLAWPALMKPVVLVLAVAGGAALLEEWIRAR